MFLIGFNLWDSTLYCDAKDGGAKDKFCPTIFSVANYSTGSFSISYCELIINHNCGL